MTKKRLLFYLCALLALFGLSWQAAAAQEPSGENGQISVRAQVEEVLSDEMVSSPYSGGEITTRVLTLRVRILEGAFQGQQAVVRQTFDEISLPSAYPAKAGDRLFIWLELDEQNQLTGSAADYVREIPIALLTGCFLLFLAGSKVKNSRESKLSLNFRPFDSGIMK